ncbi:MAG: hypothetical protein AB7T74_03050 [Clostridia bacterium]
MSTPSMMKITSNSKQVMKQLAKIPKAMQKVTAATLTETARSVTVRGGRNIKKDMVVRTPYTLRSLRTYKASASKPIERQDAVSGTVSDYLPVHDKGGKIKARKSKVAIPMPRVRGPGRKKKIRGQFKLGNTSAFVLRPTKKDRSNPGDWAQGKSKKVFGRKRGNKVVAYRLNRTALFLRHRGKLLKVRDLAQRAVRAPSTRWHSEAVKKYGNYAYMAEVFKRQAEHYLKMVARA